MAARKTSLVAALVLGVMVAAGCGLDETGVRSVAFPLEPTPMTEPPAGIDAEVVAAIAVSAGMASCDTHEDSGMVMVQGLAALPEAAQYLVVLKFASSERAGLGGGGGGEGGHTHGAISSGEFPSAGDELANLPLGKLMPMEDGSWMAAFAGADLSDHVIGALRGAMIMLIPEIGAAVMIMSGEVEEPEEAEGEGGGHEHGA